MRMGMTRNMNYEAGVELKNKSNRRVLRAAVRAACLHGLLATSVLVGSLANATEMRPAVASMADAPIPFDIPAQSLESALLRFSEQARMQVVVSNSAVRGTMSPQVKGEFSVAEALRQLLEGSELTYEVTDERTVAIRAEERTAKFQRISDASSAQHTVERIRVVDAKGQLSPLSASDGRESTPKQEIRESVLEEVLVTGSYIRGINSVASPMTTITRDEIDRAGYTTAQDVIRDLPQNVSSISEQINSTFIPLDGAQDWQNKFSAGANLRGLGGESTLVLLNGRRLARAGADTHVDLSLIPISAIERIEVLTDGASALYGSDAVGGVINMITRKDFEGAEARVSRGSADGSSYSRHQAAGVLGLRWAHGQVMLSYEQSEETPLYMHDRFDAITQVHEGTALIQASERRGAVVYAEQRLSDRVNIDAEVTYGGRNTPATMSYSTDFFAGYMRYKVDTENTGAGLGMTIDLAKDWQLRSSVGYDETLGEFTQWFGASPDSMVRNLVSAMDGDVRSANLNADGPLFELTGGVVRFAVGGEYRQEKWGVDTLSAGFDRIVRTADRNVKAAFAEIHVPLVSERNSKAAVRSLDLSLAGRFENYSDFGTSFNPKVGVAWAPVRDLRIRATAGTSFKAPTLNQMMTLTSSYVYIGLYTDADGPTNLLEVGGVASDLRPEESENWSAGFDYFPSFSPRSKLSATAFGINYKDRIGSPFPSSVGASTAIIDPSYRYIVTEYPPLSYSQELLELSDVAPTCYMSANGSVELCNASDHLGSLRYVVDARTRNLSEVRQSGIDLSLSHVLSTDLGDWSFSVSGTKVIDSTKVFVPGGAKHDQLNQAYFPVDLRLRGSIALSSEAGWSVAAYARYADSYRDTARRSVSASPQRADVASWTTVDVSAQYDLNQLLGLKLIKGLMLQLNANNVFNRSPPYVASYYGINYDPVNADAIGRFVTLTLKGTW
jgi:iron complex outermembrane receptor protein